jgi:hypothetical protein
MLFPFGFLCAADVGIAVTYIGSNLTSYARRLFIDRFFDRLFNADNVPTATVFFVA